MEEITKNSQSLQNIRKSRGQIKRERLERTECEKELGELTLKRMTRVSRLVSWESQQVIVERMLQAFAHLVTRLKEYMYKKSQQPMDQQLAAVHDAELIQIVEEGAVPFDELLHLEISSLLHRGF